MDSVHPVITLRQLDQPAHIVICEPQSKRPTYPPKGGLDGNKVYLSSHPRAGQPAAAGYEWHLYNPPANLLEKAIASNKRIFGHRPGDIGFVVVDVDTDHPIGVEILVEAVIESVGPPICNIESRSGGRHLYYRKPVGEQVGNSKWMWQEAKGGEIRADAGYAILWDAEAVIASHENLEDYEPADMTKWPFAKEKTVTQTQESSPSTEEETSEGPPESTIENWMSYLDPDDYDDWTNVGMALHSGGYDVSLWIKWSQKSDKFENGHCERKWESFTQSEDGIGFRWLRKEAQERYNQMPKDSETGEPLAWRGRPKSDDPSERTVANQRSQKRTSMKNWAFEKNLPLRFLMDDMIAADTERCIHYGTDDFATDGKNVFVSRGNVWIQLKGSDNRAMSAMVENIKRARGEAAYELGEDYHEDQQCLAYVKLLRQESVTAYHARNVMFTVMAHMPHEKGVKRCTLQDFDRRDKNPAIPLNDGTTLDLTQYPPVIMPLEKAKNLMMLDHEWNIPPPDFSVLLHPEKYTMPAAIHNRYGIELMERCAVYLLGVSKAIDSIVMPSDAGKSTLAEMMKHALPDAVSIHNASGVFNVEGSRFTPLATAVSSSMITIVDEVGHDTISVYTTMINEYAQNTVDDEKKGLQRRSVNRISSVLLMGHDWPHVNASDQGITTRFVWANDLRSLKKMTSAERAELMSYENIAYLRAWLFDTAAKLFSQYGNGEMAREEQQKEPAIQDAVANLLKSRLDPVSEALQEYLEPDKNGFVETTYIRGIFDKEDIGTAPKGKGFSKVLRRAFHNAQLHSGKMHDARGWYGLKKRTED